ncbi:QcrA and Rieske domain-containing protein [Pyrobaculum calidifontis]|uniref:Rieske (2Fe-2S) domain protein n=1 Tax=Pyrobaculum calidifontis (strain DSM 21063 / JCM 11548 / VA1) TaxID=410359 RepID=A3MXG2_PYRCJ|nr:ubiquinol-cytochrome c reductase iron-sulfur subunit [Pyrobaculum calidifontis]ABO09329.1 Rieske (2Fe-2S) domain protein [Pyrobaculum calidifontis JCM 11548]
MVDENRRNTIKILIGTTAAVGAGMLATPLVASIIDGRAGYVKPETTGAVKVEICKDVNSCPKELGVPLDELRNGPVFKLIRVNSMAIPAVFGLIRATDGKEYPAAYVAICTHFGCPLNVMGGKYLTGFNCPCHGSVFTVCNKPEGCGNARFLEMYVSGGPAVRSLRSIVVAVKDGVVYPLVAHI